MSKNQNFHERMNAFRAAAGHRDLSTSERNLLVILLSFQRMPGQRDYGTGWQVSRATLADAMYGRADKTSLNNLDRRLRALQDKGFIEVSTTNRRSSSFYLVNERRLYELEAEVDVAAWTRNPQGITRLPDGPPTRLPEVQVPVLQTDPYPSGGGTFSNQSSYSLAAAPLSESVPKSFLGEEVASVDEHSSSSGSSSSSSSELEHAREEVPCSYRVRVARAFGLVQITDDDLPALNQLAVELERMDVHGTGTMLRCLSQEHPRDVHAALLTFRRFQVENRTA